MKTSIYRLLVITLSLAGLAFLGVSSQSASSNNNNSGGQTQTGCCG
ncbi:MAG: hypothetical protein HY926_14395 [Elusimicrobia bacterium]|nr:hypothetical protein [Elusimicrobiota bacterium]